MILTRIVCGVNIQLARTTCSPAWQKQGLDTVGRSVRHTAIFPCGRYRICRRFKTRQYDCRHRPDQTVISPSWISPRWCPLPPWQYTQLRDRTARRDKVYKSCNNKFHKKYRKYILFFRQRVNLVDGLSTIMYRDKQILKRTKKGLSEFLRFCLISLWDGAFKARRLDDGNLQKKILLLFYSYLDTDFFFAPVSA